MANKDISGDKQERGWGMMLQNYFDDGIIVDNHASRENTTRYAQHQGYQVQVQENGSEWTLTFTK